jgi:hypothetical protein
LRNNMGMMARVFKRRVFKPARVQAPGKCFQTPIAG